MNRKEQTELLLIALGMALLGGLFYFDLQRSVKMTIDETGNPIDVSNLPSDQRTANVTSIEDVTLEQPEMIQAIFTRLANKFVEASDLATRVMEMKADLERITNALAVANEAAAKAIAERDEAFKARDRANALREQAEHAYQNVNEQRIATARELQEAREILQSTNTNFEQLSRNLEDTRAERDLWKEEAEKLKTDVFNATNSAASMVDAAKAERDAVISALRLEVQALKDERFDLHDKLDISELDVSMLRKIIQEAKLATAGVQGVLEGTLAAE